MNRNFVNRIPILLLKKDRIMFNTLTKEMIFPSTMVILSVLSATRYGLKGNLKMTMYWIFAAGLTASLTYLK